MSHARLDDLRQGEMLRVMTQAAYTIAHKEKLASSILTRRVS